MKSLLNWRHQKTFNRCLKNMNVLKLCVFTQRQYPKKRNFYPSCLIRALYHTQRDLPAGRFGDSSQNQKWCRCLLQSGWCPGPQPWCRGGRRSDLSLVCWSGRWPLAWGSLARARRSARTGTCRGPQTQHSQLHKVFDDCKSPLNMSTAYVFILCREGEW